jgi:hypothetical protein
MLLQRSARNGGFGVRPIAVKSGIHGLFSGAAGKD